jgi:heat induced stress protein YflT
VNIVTTNVNVTAGRDLTGRTTVAGLFAEREDAERAINELKDAGFGGDQIGVAMRDRTAQGELAEDTGTKAAEGATTGALGGGVLGGLVGFLVGVGALAIPGIGPVVAGGMLATAFGLGGGTAVAGAGIGAAAGGIAGALVGMGIPDAEAKHFETGFRAGGVLVTVRAQSRAMDALAILERNGADTGPGSVGARPAGAGPGAGTAGGALGGAAAGAAAGTAVAGPVGTVVGGAAGGIAGAAAGADAADEAGTTDANGNRVRRSRS